MRNTPRERERIKLAIEQALADAIARGAFMPNVPEIEVTVDPTDPTTMRVVATYPPEYQHRVAASFPICMCQYHPMYGKSLSLCGEPECIVRMVLEQ